MGYGVRGLIKYALTFGVRVAHISFILLRRKAARRTDETMSHTLAVAVARPSTYAPSPKPHAPEGFNYGPYQRNVSTSTSNQTCGATAAAFRHLCEGIKHPVAKRIV